MIFCGKVMGCIVELVFGLILTCCRNSRWVTNTQCQVKQAWQANCVTMVAYQVNRCEKIQVSNVEAAPLP